MRIKNHLLPFFSIILFASSFSIAEENIDSLVKAYPESRCSFCAGWDEPQAPFKIHHNSYYVGTRGLSAILITSKKGHVLLDGGLPSSAPQIINNIRTLGFSVEDIKLILNSHAHYDHAGGIAALQKVSGARVVASPKSVAALMRGNSGPEDPQYGVLFDYPKIDNVEPIVLGELLSSGAIKLTPHSTPGHTPGGTTWSWESCSKSEQCITIVYADSQTPVSAEGFRYSDAKSYPSVLKDFEQGHNTLEQLTCDILITTHPGASGVWERFAKGNGDLIDVKACKRYAATARELLIKRLAQEKAGSTVK